MSLALDFTKTTATLKTVVALMREAIIVLNEKGNVVFINHAAESMHESKAEGIIGQHIDNVLPDLVDLDSLCEGEIITKEFKLGARAVGIVVVHNGIDDRLPHGPAMDHLPLFP